MDFTTLFVVFVFVIALALIVFEVFEKAVIAMAGAVLMILAGVLNFETALHAINFEIIFLLAAMMMLVEAARETGFFTWANVKISTLSKGNPFLIFLFFTLSTAACSAFLDNVTTVIVMVPITIALLRGMGRDPKPYVIAEMMMANIGGASTIIGDPISIIIGTAGKFTFNDFIINMMPPAIVIALVIITAFYIFDWQNLKPISGDFRKVFVSNIIIKKIQYRYLEEGIKIRKMIKTLGILLITILCFFLQSILGLELAVIALAGASVMLLLARNDIDVHKIFKNVEWTTLFFFSGLFIMVAGLKETGVLELLAEGIVNITDNFAVLLIIMIWGSAIVSMLIDNVPYVTVMVPVVIKIQENLAGNPDLNLLWWSLVFGAILGGNGTLIGAAANIVGADVARKNGLLITFRGFLKYSIPISFLGLSLATAYILLRYYYF